jgi:hypothetical protein
MGVIPRTNPDRFGLMFRKPMQEAIKVLYASIEI